MTDTPTKLRELRKQFSGFNMSYEFTNDYIRLYFTRIYPPECYSALAANCLRKYLK